MHNETQMNACSWTDVSEITTSLAVSKKSSKEAEKSKDALMKEDTK